MLSKVLSGVLLLALALPLSAQAPDPDRAAETTASPSPLCAPPISSALYCMELLPTARAGEGAGVVELGRAASPFQVAVTPDGRFEYELTAWIDGLPAPSSLGPYTAYVAWATPLELFPVVRLGEVGNGENALGRVSFNKFMIMISAESDPEATERQGPLILRGRSPSSRLEAHDMLAQAPSAEQAPVSRGESSDTDEQARDPGAHGHDADAHGDDADTHGHAEDADGDGWTLPPMYPGIPMLPGVMALEPRVDPLRVVPEDVRLEDIPMVRPAQVVELPDGGTLDLEAGFVRRRLGERDLVMLAFNGQQPGPLLRVRQASTIFVDFVNRTPFPTAIHWHGLRLDNRFDGVPGVTQAPVPPGGSFRYQVHFPDPGIYWYHPHHREDVQQELGLYGNMLVDPPASDYYGPANREEVLILDDLLVDDAGALPAFGRQAATHALMGRFGNILLINGEPEWSREVERGAVVRFFFTNASNTRTFNIGLVPVEGDLAPVGAETVRGDTDPVARRAGPAPPLKLVASDVGRFEREERVSSVVLAPAERYVVEARFDEPGRYALVNRVQAINHRLGIFFPEEKVLGEVTVSAESVGIDYGAAFDRLRVHDDVVAGIDSLRHRFDDPPDRELVLRIETDSLAGPIVDAMRFDRIYANPVEWAGTMPMMNWASSAEEVRWILEDPVTGMENMDIHWRFAVGEVVRIRVHNERDVFHAMQHPLHFHGQRFLVLSQNGVSSANLVWKDTVLLPAGSTTEILLELSNPGRWMVHCHISEHLEAGMKFVLDVAGR